MAGRQYLLDMPPTVSLLGSSAWRLSFCLLLPFVIVSASLFFISSAVSCGVALLVKDEEDEEHLPTPDGNSDRLRGPPSAMFTTVVTSTRFAF